jgi:glutathione S-transferase
MAKDKNARLHNIVQRCHANYLENLPIFLVGLLFGGLKYPVLSSTLGAAWLAFRVLYTIGYASPQLVMGKGRTVGYTPAAIIQSIMLITSATVGFQMISV